LDTEAMHEFKKKQKFGLLQALDHKKIDYGQFRKDFYQEDEAVANMSDTLVASLR
jgi:hypothetical protein